MNLLDFARGAAMKWSIAVFLFGVLWRLFGVLLLRRTHDYSAPRTHNAAFAALQTIISRSWPRKEFQARTAYGVTVSYVFHVGLAIVVFGFVPHILLIHSLIGVGWDGLPGGVVYFFAVITLVALLMAIIRRLTHPVLRLLSNFDDYFSWLVTAAPVITGLLAVAHYGARYETLLAVHILSFELLLIWFPFGKLMHSLLLPLARGQTGAYYGRRGAST